MTMKWARLLSSKRFRDGTPRSPEDGRSEFQKDYDRIVFCRAFRRLQGKTQVHPMPDNDHVHTRLSHTLEVASVGRSLGARAGISLAKSDKLPTGMVPQDVGAILQAACLAHDIGNPPFGHAGEFAIRGWFQKNQTYLGRLSDMEKLDLQNFEGNAQGLRILAQLEGHLFDGGLRPTLATLGSFVKYPWSSGHAASIQKPKFGFFQSEKEHMEEIASELGLTPKGVGSWARHPLAYLVEAADDICYAIIDLEDALEVGILDFNEVESILLNGLSPNERHQYETIYAKDLPRRVSYLRGKIVDYLVQEVMYVFFNEEVSILNGEFVGDLISRCGDAATNIISSAENLASRKVFHQPRKTQIEIGAYSIIDVLLTAFCDANSEFKNSNPSFRARRVFDLLGVGAPATDQELYQSLIRITDFVSGSTDKYAAQLSRRLIGMDF